MQKVLPPRLAALIPALIVAISAGATAMLLNTGVESPVSEAATPLVSTGRYYYLSVGLVEVAEHTPEGQSWDAAENAAPDVYYRILWRGNPVYTSPVRDDSLVVKWDEREVDVEKIVLSGGKASAETMIPGARISIASHEKVELQFFDRDLVTADDEIDRFELRTDELVVGEKFYEFSGRGIRRVLIKVKLI